MKMIQDQSLSADLVTQGLTGNWLGDSQDSATAFAMAADADALSERLMDCADARLTSARNAVWGDSDALFYNAPAALNQTARALYLIEQASAAKQFSERMLDAAVQFELTMYLGGLESPEREGDFMVATDDAQIVWGGLMADGIFDSEMYGEWTPEVMTRERDEVSDGINERREFARNRDAN